MCTIRFGVYDIYAEPLISMHMAEINNQFTFSSVSHDLGFATLSMYS